MIKKAAAARSPEELVALLSAVSSAILAVIIVATLYFGREIFVPVALAILLSFVLAPVVNFLQRIRIPRAVAVVSVVALAFAAIFGLGGLMATQLTQLAGDLPRYQSTMREKIQSFRGATAGSGTLERAADMLQDLSKELDKPKDTTRASAGPLVRQAWTSAHPARTGRGSTARSGRSREPPHGHLAPNSPPRNHGHHCYLRHLHSSAARRPPKPLHPACGRARPERRPRRLTMPEAASADCFSFSSS